MKQADAIHENMKTTLESEKQSHEGISTSWKESIDSQELDFSTWSSDFGKLVARLGKDTEHFISNGLTEDLPTGIFKNFKRNVFRKLI